MTVATSRVHFLLKNLVFIVLIVMGACGKKTGFFPVKWPVEKLPEADVVIDRFTSTSYKEQKTEWYLIARKAYVVQDTGLTHIYDFEITFYEKGVKANMIQAKEGVLDNEKHQFHIQKNVLVTSVNGRELKTNSLTWYEKSKLLFTKEPVEIRLPEGDIIKGTGFQADQKLNKFVLFNGRGVHPPE